MNERIKLNLLLPQDISVTSRQSALQYADSFGVFAKCLKAAASFVPFAHTSVRTEQLGHAYSKDVVRSKERSPWKKKLPIHTHTHAHTHTHIAVYSMLL